jgi:hypothetical protein
VAYLLKAKTVKPAETAVARQQHPWSSLSRWRNCIVASKTTSGKEKKVPVNKVRASLALPPTLKTVRAKVMSRSNRIRRPGESHVKIHNQKVDYSKITSQGKH